MSARYISCGCALDLVATQCTGNTAAHQCLCFSLRVCIFTLKTWPARQVQLECLNHSFTSIIDCMKMSSREIEDNLFWAHWLPLVFRL